MGIQTLDDVLLSAIGGIIAEAGGGVYDSVQRITDVIQDDGELQSANVGISANVYTADGERKFHITVTEEEA